MSIPDDLMRDWFELLTNTGAEEITLLTDGTKTHPMEAKKKLGKEIVSFYYGDSDAEEAAAEWAKRFSQRQDPTDIPEQTIPRGELTDGRMPVCRLLVVLGMAKSNNDARRLVEGGAVSLGPDRSKITDPKVTVPVHDGLIVRAGSRQIKRVRLQ